MEPAAGLFSALDASIDRLLVAAEASHAPTRVKICEGICSAWGAEGAISA